MKIKLSEIAQKTNSQLIGNQNLFITNISYNEALSDHIIFISSHKKIPSDIEKYGAVLTDSKYRNFFQNSNLLLSNNPRLSFAKLTNMFRQPSSKPKRSNDIEFSDCFIGKGVKFSPNLSVGTNVVLEDNVKIGSNVSIGHNVVIYSNTTIGDNVTIESGTIIGSEGFGNVMDDKGKWHHISHLGSVIIMDNVFIGSNCTIDKGTLDNTVIHSGVIIDNQVHIAHNVEIGEDTAIAAKVGIAGSCFIGKRNKIGGMVGIIDHINTADDVVISATSTVIKDIKESGIYSGIMPTLKHVTWKRISFWITKLDKIVKFLNLKKI